MVDVLQQIVNGVAIASVIALVAIGITVIFGLTGIVNFAHGEFLVVGGFLTWWLALQGVPYAAAVVVCALAVGALGVGLERGLWRFTLKAPINGFIISLGLSIVLQHAVIKIWNPSATPVSIQSPVSGEIRLGDLVISNVRIMVIVLTAAVLGATFWAVERTRHGRALRAIAEDRDTAALMGIPVRRYITAVFGIGSLLAGLGGALLLALFPISPFSGQSFVIKGFAVALIGGLGNITGAVIAALMLGLAEAFSAGYLAPQWTGAYAFILMIAILLFRPQGILRGTEGSRVT